jgi:hypothetical protein
MGVLDEFVGMVDKAREGTDGRLNAMQVGRKIGSRVSRSKQT